MSDAEIILRDLLNCLFSCYNRDITVKALTTGGANYTSALYAIEIPDNENNLKLFGKVGNVNGPLREAMNAGHMYNTEQYIYKELVKVFNDLEEKHDVPREHRFKFPKYYGSNPNLGEETIILEDLTKLGYNTYSRLKSVDWEHAKISVTALARFHALSFSFKKEDREEYNKIIEKFKAVDNSKKEENRKILCKINENAINVIQNDDYKAKFIIFLKEHETSLNYKKFKMPLNVPVLLHGDYRSSNLLFKRVNGILETIVVDYQTIHTGSPVADLLYFIVTGSDEEFRRNYYEELLDHYYNELTLALGRLKIDINDAYPREIFDNELKEMLPCALSMSIVILPIVTVDAANAPQVAATDATVSNFAINPNELFAERFNGLIRDYVRWGVL